MNNIFRTEIVVLAAISLFTHSTSDSAITATTAPAWHYYLTKNALSGNQMDTLRVMELCPWYELLDVAPFSAAWPMGAE